MAARGRSGAGTRASAARCLETLQPRPCTVPQNPHTGARAWSSGLWKARAGARGMSPGIPSQAPGSPGSRRVPPRPPAPARRELQPGQGGGLAQVSGPRAPPRVNYAGGWHRRARAAQVSLATLAGALRAPGPGPLRRAARAGEGSAPGDPRRSRWRRWSTRAGATPSGGPRRPASASDRAGRPRAGCARRPSTRDGRARARAWLVFQSRWGRPKRARPMLVTVGFGGRAFSATLGLSGGSSGRAVVGGLGVRHGPGGPEATRK